ncbi:ribonuclease H-like domain-containing protein [Candidatus Micrarchaeota archaeon]|nr:ribonuclease H-like domain-containing protein [Candidatus Micrarchaeota archaeon]
MEAWLLDVSYVHSKKAIRLLLKANGKSIRAYHKHEPYFYLKPKDEVRTDAPKENADGFASTIEQLKKIQTFDGEKNYNLERIEPVERLLEGKKTQVLKLVVAHPGLVPKFQDLVRQYGETYEFNILFTRRYLIDNQLTPSSPVEVEFEDKNGLRWVTSIRTIPSEEIPPANVLAFDIETYNPSGMPEAKRDPMLMLSYADAHSSNVITYAKPARTERFVQNVASEKEVLERFAQVLREKHTDVLCTYNGDVFDVPYISERAFQTRATTHFGRDHAPAKTKRLGLRNVTSLGGRIHFDVYNTVFFLNYIGATKLQRMTQLAAYEGLLGKTKVDFPKDQIVPAWDNGGQLLTDLIEYSRQDAVAAYELAQYCLPLFYALGKVTGTTLFDASRFSSGQLVEALLLKKAFDRGEIVPNKPTAEEVAARTAEPIQGAYVKLPQAGVYENMAVYDFKSLYPSIIISHNIDPSTLDCECCRGDGEAHVSPMGHRFCKKRLGLIPAMLQEVLTTRFAIQKQMKALDKDSAEYKQLYGKQWALKILANSTYGVLLYPRFRWFRRECGESVTAYGRQYIQDTIAKAEKDGFNVLYADTDSVFFQYGNKSKQDVLNFAKNVNAALPESMQLELEDFYPRGIFVSKKQEETGAKKKYALINEEGKIKIRGFELVRRDWSKVARNTQRSVLEILLKEGDVKKAAELVRTVVNELKSGKTPMEDCVIYTQLKKKVANYEIKSPEVGAVIHARKNGVNVPEGATVAYVITTDGGGGASEAITEKARILELAKNYDPEYYINNQVLPAVLKILGSLGYDKDSIKIKGTQKGLGEW